MFRKSMLVVACSFLTLLAGCGVAPRTATTGTQAGLSGTVHGGQQPVVGATIQLYSVGTAGDGSPATPLLTVPVLTTAGGAFNITGDYSCVGATEVYMVATGGNPGLAQNNPNLALMTALGPCSALTPSTNISVNELTTVAAVYALAPFMTNYAAIGSSGADVYTLNSAFNLAGEYVDPSTGMSPGVNVPNGDTVPIALMNTLADVIAACINSGGGAAGDQSVCGQMFTLTTPPAATPPVNTIGSLLNLARNPTLNTGALFSLSSPSAPFQPTLSVAPPDFRVRLSPPANQLTLQIAPGSLIFAPTAVGLTSSAQAVTIMNSSAAAVTLTGISVIGTNPGDFTQTSNCGASLAANAGCTVQVSFTPVATGARSGYLSIASSTPDSPQYVALSGNGFTGTHIATLSALGLQFATVGTSQDVTLTNTGTASLTIASISTATQFYSATSDCGAGLAVGSSCTVRVSAQAPRDSFGLLSNLTPVDYVTVATNDPTPNPGIMLSESYNAASPANLLFPGTSVGSTSSQQVTYSLNSYMAPCPVASVTGSGFQVSLGTASSSMTNTRSVTSCAYTLAFQPNAPGAVTGRLSFGADSGYLPLTGMGTAPSASTAFLSAASLTLSNTTTGSLTLSNSSSSGLTIQSVVITGPFTQSNNCGTTLPAQSLCTITITPTNTLTGTIEGGLTITDDAGVQAATLIDTLDLLLDFGASDVGLVSPVTFTVPVQSAVGTTTLAGVSFTSTGDFMGTGCSAIRGGSCLGFMNFTPAAIGTRTGTFSITSNNIPYNGATLVTYSQGYRAKGAGAAAGPLLTLTAITFVQTAVGATYGTVYPYTLYNSGSTTIALAPRISTSGQNPSDFGASYVSDNRGNLCTTLAPGGSCTVNFHFTPSQLGLRTANLVVTDTNSGASFSFPVAGAGTFPAPLLTPTYFIFGAQHLNTTSTASTTVNSSGHPIQASFENVAAGSSPAGYSLTKSSCAQNEIPCVLTVSFTPQVASNGSTMYNQQIAVEDALTLQSSQLGVSGEGGEGTAGVAPGAVNFAARPVGSTSLGSVVTLTNSGDGPLPFSSVFRGANSSEFILTNNCGAPLAAQTSCTYSVMFAPTSAGTKTASLTINGSGGTGLPLTVSITGTAQ